MLLWSGLLGCAPHPPPEAILAVGEGSAEVPLIRGDGDARPRIAVQLRPATPEAIGVLDLTGDTIRVGRLLALRRGIRLSRDRSRAAVDVIRIGELVVHDPPVEVVGGEELVVGVGALGGVSAGVLASRGVVVFAPDPAAVWPVGAVDLALDVAREQAWREGGERRRGKVPAALAVEVDGVDVLLQLRSDAPWTTLDRGAGRRAPRRSRCPGRARAAGAAPRPGWWPTAPTPDPRGVAGALGADLLADRGVAVDPVHHRLGLAPAPAPRWQDAAAARRALLRPRPRAGPAAAGRRRRAGADALGALAEARFAAGDAGAAADADEALALVAGDRRDLARHRAAAAAQRGRRPGRGARPRRGAVRALGGPEPVRAERIGCGAWPGVEVRQPARCERAAGLRALLGGPPSPLDALDPGRALATGQLGPMRAALGRAGATIGPARRHRRDAARRGRLEPAVARAVAAARAADDAHPLTTALVLGPALVRPAVAAVPDWLVGRLLLAAAEEPDQRSPPTPTWRRSPAPETPPPPAPGRWPTRSTGGSPSRPSAILEADCLAGRALLHPEGPALALLRARWPDRVR
ncbi:MAG: hypothetical protein R3F59_34310 [Myxococcota bacterium]